MGKIQVLKHNAAYQAVWKGINLIILQSIKKNIKFVNDFFVRMSCLTSGIRIRKRWLESFGASVSLSVKQMEASMGLLNLPPGKSQPVCVAPWECREIYGPDVCKTLKDL